MLAAGQAPGAAPEFPPDTAAPPPAPAPPPGQQQAQPPAQNPAAPAQQPAQTPPAPAQPASPEKPPALNSPPLAIVPLDTKIPGTAATVSGDPQLWKGRAYLTQSGAITAGPATAQVTLPYRGVLRVCPSTTVRLSVDSTVPTTEIPGMQIALNSGAMEASFAIARDSDIFLTPNFRIMIAGPGSSEVKLRLGQGGDTCVDNSGQNAPYVVVTSVFDTGLYRVQPGQRVMFEHGDLHTVVDDEKEPCGCPPQGQAGNEFPLAQSEGLAPSSSLPPTTSVTNQPEGGAAAATTMVYNAAGNGAAQPAPIPEVPAAAPATNSAAAANPQAQPQKKPGFFTRVGRFFKKIFGAE